LSAEGIVTYMGIAHPWMCDAMGHLNTRHYAAMLDDAGFQLLALVSGVDGDTGRLGWADAHLSIDFEKETTAGTPVLVRTMVEKVGTTSLTYRHALCGSVDGIVRVRARVVTVRFDLQARSKAPLGVEIVERIRALVAGDVSGVPAGGAGTP
jgi:acyl-CoA thioester hydrolase